MTPKPELIDIALSVGDALRRHGITAVLTGGACAAVHTGGTYHSVDVDFVLTERVRQKDLDEAMASVRFVRHRDRYVHPEHEYFVEFPRPPLAIGSDTKIEPDEFRKGARVALILSPTDSCRDRLAAFYHWNDVQSLEVAVGIARRHRVDMKAIRQWSDDEDSLAKFERFRVALRRRS